MKLRDLLRLLRQSTPAEYAVIDSWVELAYVASQCAQFFAKTQAGDRKMIDDFERRGNDRKRVAYRNLDRAGILTLIKNEEVARRLTKQLDAILGGMRRAANHVEIWRPMLGNELPKDAQALLEIIPEVVEVVLKLAEGFKNDLTPEKLKELTTQLDTKEKQADDIRLEAEKALVVRFATALERRNSAELYAHILLLDLLEETIDAANHAGGTFENMMKGRKV